MNFHLFQRLSWWLNLALAAAAVLLVELPTSGRRSPGDVGSSSVPPPVGVAKVAKVPVAAFPASASPQEQRRALIDALRAMGMPNRVLARIVLADLDAAATKYSAAVAIKTRGNPDTMAALQLELDRNRDAEMRAALGEEGFKAWDHENMLREMNRGNVPWSAEETEAGYSLWKQLQLRQLDLREAQLKGTIDPSEVSAALEKAAGDYTAQMKTLLGGDRYARALRPANDVNEAALREDVGSVATSERQFSDLLQAQRRWNDQRAELDRRYEQDPASSTYAAQIKALDDARDEAYRNVLGADAFATLRKQQDAGYANMKKHQDLWGLDDTTIDSVYGALAYYQKGVADYESSIRTLEAQGQKIDRATVDQNLRDFTRQTEQSFRNALGDERFSQLQRNGIFNPLAEPPHYARPNDNIDRTNTVSIR